MADDGDGSRVPKIFKILARVAIDALKSVVALFKKLSELIASAVGVDQSVKAVMTIFYGLIIAMLLGFILTLRSCAGSDEVATTSTTVEIATTTEAPPTSTSTSSTTTTVPEPTTTTLVPVLNPVSQGSQEEKATTTTVKAPTRKTTPKTTVAPTTSTTIAPTTTLPPTTTTVPPRLVTFTFVNDEISATQWTDTQKTSSITDFVSVSSTDSVWVKSLPNGTTQFKFRMYRFRNPLGYYPTRFSNVVGATCVDDLVEDYGVGRVRPAFAPDLNSYVTVTCDATGTGSITVPLVYSHPTA